MSRGLPESRPMPHYMLLGKNRTNDVLSDLLCAFPLFVSTSTYRRNHLKHHAYLDTDLDPDWMVRIQEPTVRRDWEFPKSRRQLCWLSLRELLGGGALYMLTGIRRFGGRGMAGRNPVRRGPAAQILRGMYYVVVAGVFTTLGLWVHFFLWWVIPAFTFLPALLRVRGIAEHFGLPGQHELNNARNIHAPFWERWLLAPHYICRHLDHHLFPYVPFYRLPELHRILEREPVYRQLAHENHAYFFGGRPAVVDDLLGTVTAERPR